MSPREQRLRLLKAANSKAQNWKEHKGTNPDHLDRRSLRALYLDLRDDHLKLLAEFSRIIGGAESGSYLN